MTNKKTIRALKRYAEKNTKDLTYYALEKYYKPKWDDESQEWKVGTVGEFKVNIGRRTKKVYKKYGLQAALYYITINLKDELKDKELEY